MRRVDHRKSKRGTVLILIVGVLAMLFMLVTAYITLARFDRLTLNDARKGEQTDQVLASLNDMIASELAQLSSIPGASVSGGGYDNGILGYGSGSVISAMDPVRRKADSFSTEPIGNGPKDLRYPSVTSLTGSGSGTKALTEMMRDDDRVNGVVVDPENPDLMPTDTRSNARNPRGDADGDGIPDSSFQDVRRATELVNAATGASVSANFDPTKIDWTDPDDPTLRAWLHFDEQALYEAAVRVVSHGGMVQIALPNEPAYYGQREFLKNMFNWVAHPEDLGGGDFLGATSNDPNMMADAWNMRGAIEPLLRARGGLLMGAADDAESLPPALRLWQEDRFRHTFNLMYQDPAHGGFEKDHWQRFNLSPPEWIPYNKSDWEAWRQAVNLDADAYNQVVFESPMSPDPRNVYVRRRLLTTVNFSDEVAREQRRAFTNNNNPSLTQSMGIDPGQLKYYLGRITDLTPGPNGVPRGAFLASGRFNNTQPTPETAQGFKVIEELAAYFHEMLGAYTDDDQAVSRRQQAYMLAVNTVAFASPTYDGAINRFDTVYYTDDSNPANQVTYFGYTPQPFITQVVAYNNQDDPNETIAQLSLAIELYNPNDARWNDLYFTNSLDLSQYAITVDGADPEWYPLSAFNPPIGTPSPYMPGRSFVAFKIHESQNSWPPGMPGVVASTIPLVNPLRVKLWRRGGDTSPYYLVDEMQVKTHDLTTGEELEENVEGYVSAERDLNPEQHLGVQHNRPARWRMTVAYEPEDDYYEDGWQYEAGDPSGILLSLGTPDLQQTERFGPTVPLYTMNADRGTVTIHGVPRPSSFPTVGFMLFVPRFSHMESAGSSPDRERWPMTEILRAQWRRVRLGTVGGSTEYTSSTVPVDFGHMPVFENAQDILSDMDPPSGFVNRKAGRLPWGLLVFDYFTTLDPDGPDGEPGTGDEMDPYRVPGRINVNTAPWYLLAGLPVIGPRPTDIDGDGFPDIDLHTLDSGSPSNISPAFWSSKSGILTGYGSLDAATPRAFTWDPGSNWATTPARLFFDADATYRDESGGEEPGSWRLGPFLAQAAAAYRDGVPYAVAYPMPVVLAQADTRNLNRSYRAARYGEADDKTKYPGGIRRRGKTENDQYRGFLTLGELANVAGFDSSTVAALSANPAPTVLSDVGHGAPDFFRAISLMALLDTHFLTTRSNTYTIYTALFDRENSQASMRSQVTIDRSRLVPRLIEQDFDGDGQPDKFITVQDTGDPEIIGDRRVGYFNARYDN